MSVFHFALNLILVQQIAPFEYGIFAFSFALALIASSMSNALFTVPLSVFRPGATSGAERTMTDHALSSGMGLFVAATLGVGGLATAVAVSSGRPAMLVAAPACYIASQALRLHSRGASYARFQGRRVLGADLVYVTCAATTCVAYLVLATEPRSAPILALLTAGNVLATVVQRLPGQFKRAPLSTILANYQPYWPHTKWALLGATATMIVAQGHGIAITVLKSPSDFAPVAAGFVIFGPVRVLFNTVQNVLRPEMASNMAAGNLTTAVRLASYSSAVSIGAVVAIALTVKVFWARISESLFADQYSEVSMGRIVALWALVSLVVAGGVGPSALLQAMRVFKQLALAALAAGLVNVALVAVALQFFGPTSTILGVAVAESLLTIGMLWMLRRSVTS